MKSKTTILIIISVVVLAGVAVYTAIRLFQLRQEAVAPTVPESRPAAVAPPQIISCTKTVWEVNQVAAASPSPTPTPSATPAASPTASPTPSASARVSLPATEAGIPVSGTGTPTLIGIGLGALLIIIALIMIF